MIFITCPSLPASFGHVEAGDIQLLVEHLGIAVQPTISQRRQIQRYPYGRNPYGEIIDRGCFGF
jgi:hypothetical protein